MDMLRIPPGAGTVEEYDAYIAERYTPERYRRYATFPGAADRCLQRYA